MQRADALRPLPFDDARAFLVACFGAEPALLPELLELVDRAPLGLRLIARKLHTYSSSRLLERFRGRAHRLRAADGERPIERLLRERVDGLEPRYRSALEGLAAFDGAVNADELQAVCGKDAARDALPALERAGLVFRHEHDALLGSLVRGFLGGVNAGMSAAHARFVRALCEPFHPRNYNGDDEPGAQRAWARLWRRRADVLRLHAKALAAVHADEEQLILVSHALARAQRAEFDQERAQAIWATEERCEGASKQEALLCAGWSDLVTGRGDSGRRAREVLRDATRGSVRQEARCLSLWSEVCTTGGEDDAAEELMRVRTTCRDERVRAEASAALARFHLRRGRHQEALRELEPAITGARRAGMFGRLALLLYRRMQIAWEAGELRDVLEWSEETRRVALRHGAPATERAVRVRTFLCRAELGEDMNALVPEMLAVLDEGRGAHASAGTFLLSSLAIGALFSGARARAFLEPAVVLASEARRPWCEWLASLEHALDGGGDAALPSALALPAHRRLAERLLRVAPERCARPTMGAEPSEPFALATRGTCFWADGWTEIRRPLHRRILRLLIRERLLEAGRARSIYELFAGAWPEEDAHPDQIASRVYLAVHELRQLGLGERIVSTGDGYALCPSTPLWLLPRTRV